MKIVHLCTFQKYGGATTAARRIIDAIKKTGLKVTMLVHKPEFEETAVTSVTDSWFNHYYNLFLFLLDRFHFFLFAKNRSVWFAFSPSKFGFPVHLRQEIKEADLLHLHWTSFGYISIEELAKLKKPIVWTLHDMWLFTGGCHYSNSCRNFENQCGNCSLFLRFSSPHDLSHQTWLRKQKIFPTIQQVVVAPSYWLAQEAKKSSLLQNVDIKVIPYAIDTSIFKPLIKENARKSLNLPPDIPLILFAAAKVSDERKGLKYFIEALHILKKTLSLELEVVIMGGKVPIELKALIPYPVHTTGGISDLATIATIYSAVDVFTITSLEDNLPNTIIESLACGTPVVGFNVGGIPEMISHLNNGYVAQYKSPDDIADGINWVLSHNDYTSLSLCARKSALETYSEDSVAAQYISIYQSVV